MDAIIAAMGDVIDLVGTVLTAITGQPLLLFLLATSLVPVAIGVFVKFKRAAKA